MSLKLFYSKPAKTILYLGIPVILLTRLAKGGSVKMITQILLYLSIAYNAECLIEGGCKTLAWLSILLPIIYSISFILSNHPPEMVYRTPLNQIVSTIQSKTSQQHTPQQHTTDKTIQTT